MSDQTEQSCDCPCHTTEGVIHAAPCCGPNAPVLDTMTPEQEEERLKGIEDFVANKSFTKLRADIIKHVTAAIESGKILLQEAPSTVAVTSIGEVMRYGPVEFRHWHSFLPKSQQQQFNCLHCQQAWMHLGSMAVLNEDGSITYPLVEAYKENLDDSILANFKVTSTEVIDHFNKSTQQKNLKYMPLGNLNGFFVDKEVGGFAHFTGASEEVVNAYNANYFPFTDLEYVNQLYNTLMSKDLDVDILEKLVQYVEQNIGKQVRTALGRGQDMIDAIKTMRSYQQASRYSYVYLWSLLSRTKMSWLRHLRGSTLGIVLDCAVELKGSTNLEAALVRVKQLLATATDPENYKNKTAEASDASIEQVVKFMTDNGLEHTLERRLLPFSEVESIIWLSKTQEEVVVDPIAPMTALQAARQKLIAKKKPENGALALLSQKVGDFVKEHNMSIYAFLAALDTYATIAVSIDTPGTLPVMVTTSLVDGDHAKLLNFSEKIHKHASVLQMAAPVPTHASFDMAEIINEGWSASHMPRVFVDGIFTYERIVGEEPNYVLQVANMGFNFYERLRIHGTCILGSMFKSEHFGMSRAAVELSRTMEMNMDAGKGAAGGYFLMRGMVLDVVRHDGQKEKIVLTSLK